MKNTVQRSKTKLITAFVLVQLLNRIPREICRLAQAKNNAITIQDMVSPVYAATENTLINAMNVKFKDNVGKKTKTAMAAGVQTQQQMFVIRTMMAECSMLTKNAKC